MSASPGTAARATMDSRIQFAQCDFEAPLWLKAKHSFILPEDLRLDVHSITRFEFAKAVDAMEARLGTNRFALGDRFSAADVMLGHTGSWARNAKFDIKSDVVNNYLDRVLGRVALAQAREIESQL